MCFFQKVTPNFFYISDILVQKLKLFVFYMMLNSQVLKKVSFQEKRRKIKVSEGARPFPLKIFDTKISVNSTSGECIICNLWVKTFDIRKRGVQKEA